jgi:hypothetical protein
MRCRWWVGLPGAPAGRTHHGAPYAVWPERSVEGFSVGRLVAWILVRKTSLTAAAHA